MERVIGVNDLRKLGLLGVEYPKSDLFEALLDLYDAFVMYLIVNDTFNNDRVILKDGNYTLDSSSCFNIGNWLV
ncbi:MAG: hypothetical protein U0586_11490 [Candidatus Brocadiaceae bacterium]